MIGTQTTHTKLFTALGIGGIALFGATACNVNFSLDLEGSGVSETVTYDFDSFDQVDISSGFTAEITVQEGPPTVEVTIDDNLVDDLEVKVEDGELNIDMKGNNINFGVDPTVIITMPDLTELELSGAASATVDGADGSALKLNFSGASDAEIDGSVQSLTIDGSGASDVTFVGSADEITLDLSGASSADLTSTIVKLARVDMSGGSDASFETIDEVTGDLSGASSINVPNGTNVGVSTSGAASVDRN